MKHNLPTKEDIINSMLVYAETALHEHLRVVAIDPLQPISQTPQITFITQIVCAGEKPYRFYYCNLEDGRTVDLFQIRIVREDLHIVGADETNIEQ